MLRVSRFSGKNRPVSMCPMKSYPRRLLSNIRPAFAAFVAIVFLTSVNFGQTTSTGTLEGRVQNAVTGRYLNNARLAVKDTAIIGFTNESGAYRLNQVPSGPAVLEVFYTGLDVQRIPLTVPSSRSITLDVTLTNAALVGPPVAAVKLDPFVIAATRETDGAAIAINEQRFAPNIKNVVSTDSQGEVMGGNIGEFLKYIPGLDAGPVGGAGGFEPDGILVRGFPSGLTVVTSDGAPMANSGTGRAFTLEQISINNIARVEVTKVPTPATGADSMSGSVNMVSKSAFERAQAQFRYNVNLTANSRALTLARQPDALEERMYRVVPGMNFDYTLPITKNLGLVVAGLHYLQFVSQVFSNHTFQTSGAGTGATFATPYYRQHQLQDSPQYRTRDSGSIKVDWRIARYSVLSFGLNSSYFKLRSGNYNFLANVGTAPAPSVAGGTALSFGPDFTVGATGRGSIGQTAGFNIRYQAQNGGNLIYRLNDGNWKIDAMASKSLGKSWTLREDRGFFGGITTTAKVPVRLTFRDINSIGPGTTEVYNNTNQRFDLYDIGNYDITTAAGGRRDLREEMEAGSLDVKRALRFLPFPASIQIGGARKEHTRDLENFSTSYTYNGISGDRSAARFAARVYTNVTLPVISSVERNNGGKSPPYVSPTLIWEAYRQDPSLFTVTPTQMVTTERGRIVNSQFFNERVDAAYMQTEMRLLGNRLNILTGVRYEKTTTYGEGLLQTPEGVWMRNPDGSFARNAAGARIRRPDAGAAGSLAELPSIYHRRGYKATKSYDGYYPSLHLTFNVTENFIARAAYAKTYGRPNYTDVVPNTVINENDLGVVPDPTQVPGTLTLSNPALRPWTADNYDLTLEYYTPSGGVFGAGVFRKDIRDFFGDLNKVATVADTETFGLGPEYAGWLVNTSINAGNARVSGMEISFNQPLRHLGRWGQPFRVFANATKLKTEGAAEANFSGYLPKVLNCGVTFNQKPFIVMLKINYRGRQRYDLVPNMGPDAYNYVTPKTHVDLNVDYQLRNNLSFFMNMRNLFNANVEGTWWGSQTPDYAKQRTTRDFGAILSTGIKGSF